MRMRCRRRAKRRRHCCFKCSASRRIDRRWGGHLVLGMLVTLIVQGQVRADPGHITVKATAAGFQISAVAHLEAAPAAVAAVLLDFAQYPTLNPSILEARVIAHSAPDSWRVRTMTRGCVAGFCRTVRQEQQFVRQSCWEVTARLVPDSGNLQASRARWRLAAESGGTQVRWEASFKPDFWLPPLLGKPLLERFLRQDSKRFLAGLTRAASRVDLQRLDTRCRATDAAPQA